MKSLCPYVCVKCRSSLKRPDEKNIFFRTCVICGENAVKVDVRFRPPKKTDDKEWQKIEFLFQHGFYFQKVYRQVQSGVYLRISYPLDLKAAKVFVVEFQKQALKY